MMGKVEGGFTLIELIIVIGILSVIGVFGSQMFLETTEIFLEARNRRDAVHEARYAIERMSREIREDIDSTADIIAFTASTFTYTDPNSASISFTKSGNDLLRNSDVLAGNVSDLTFTYLKADGTTASSASDIWRIKILLTVAKDDATITLQSQVFPRNLYNDITGFAGWAEQ
jgi:prepilin-type N-terminal cleavage/methylation domain-containing protein